VTVAVEVLAPDDGLTDMMLLVVTMTVTIVDTEVVPSLTVIEYWPACAGEVAKSDITSMTPLALVEILPVVTDKEPVLTVQLAVGKLAAGLSHAAGMFGEPESVISVLAFKPLACMNNFALVLAGTKVVPELPETVSPRASVTFGVTVNVATPVFPLLSVTVIACAPATPAKVVVVPAGIWNTNTDVPCSVTGAANGAIVAALLEPTTLPTATELIVAVGPNPVTVAVTTVPTGPEVGDNVTVVVPSESVVVALLVHKSLRMNAEPAVIPGRLTVACELTELLLRTAGSLVLEPEATVIAVPANDAAAILLDPVAGNPEPVTITEDPAATVDGLTATEGLVIVNVPATTEVTESVMITVCAPSGRP
jgi:hypothetical protein